MREAIDDATLTSYALGELNEAERAAVEARLAESEALRNELREIEAVAVTLRQAYAAAPRHALTDTQRSMIEAEALRSRPMRVATRRSWLTGGLAAAAVVLLALSASWLVPGSPWNPTRPPAIVDRGTADVPDRPAGPPGTTASPVVASPVAQAPAEPMRRPVGADTATPPPGPADAGVPPASYKRVLVTGILANVADIKVVDVTLQPGPASDTVVTAAENNGVKTVGAEISGVMPGEQVRELPLNGRNFMQLTRLQPGLVPPEVDQVEEFKVQRGVPQGSPLAPQPTPLPESLRPSSAEFTTEAYDRIDDNPFVWSRRIRLRPSRSTSTRPPTPTCAAS